MAIETKQLLHTGEELDQAITDWMNTLIPVYTLPAQVKFSAVCNPTIPSVNVSWVWGDKEFASGIMIRRKLGAVPQHVGDGELVCDIVGSDAVAYEDTNFDATDSTTVGTYETPVSWFYRAFPYNINGQYQTHYQTSGEYGMKEVGVYTFGEDGAVLSTLALKDKVIFGKWGENELVWRISTIRDDKIKLTLDYDQLFSCQFDAPEPSNANANRVSGGSNRYATSNIRQFLNASGPANEWFVAQTDTDVLSTSYNNKNGFLYGFTDAERSLIVPEVLTCIVPDEDGGGTETITDIVWLPSSEEMGYTGAGYEGESEAFDIFTGADNTNANRIENWGVTHWTRTRVSGTAHQVRSVHGYSGGADTGIASNSFYVRAGLTLPPSSFITWDTNAEMFRIRAV